MKEALDYQKNKVLVASEAINQIMVFDEMSKGIPIVIL